MRRGEFVALLGESGVGKEVFAQLRDPGNNPIGGLFRVLGNVSDSDLDQYVPDPVVAALPNGGFIVVSSFGEYIASGNSGEAVIGKVYDNAGNLVTVEPHFDDTYEGFLISSSTARISSTARPEGRMGTFLSFC